MKIDIYQLLLALLQGAIMYFALGNSKKLTALEQIMHEGSENAIQALDEVKQCIKTRN